MAANWRRPTRQALILLLLLMGFLASLALTARRWIVEEQANCVAVVMSYADIRLLADAAGLSSFDCMRAFAASEKTAVAVILPGTAGEFDAEAASEIHRAGLRLTLSPTDTISASAYRAAREALGADFPVYLPMGGRVDALEETGLTVALIEDAAQYTHVPIDGFDADTASSDMARAFHLAPAYQRRYGVYGYAGAEEIQNILSRAAVDRRARVLWLTPFIDPKTDEIVGTLSEYTALLEHLSDRLSPRLLLTGDTASAIAPHTPSPWLLSLSYLGLAAALLLLLRTVVTPPAAVEYALLALGAAAAVGGALLLSSLTAKAMALGAAVVFPCLAANRLTERLSHGAARPGPSGLLTDSFLALLTGLGITLAGCVFISGILSDSRYLLSIDSFSGVKLSQALPLVYAALLLYRRFLSGSGRNALSIGAPAAVCVLILGAVVVFFVLGTGDDGWLRGGLWERRLRNFLELTLPVRPRLKELLFAWPSLVLAVLCCGRGLRVPAAAFLLAASAGFASVTNTFCHIRADLSVSLLRTALGAGGGWVLGSLIALVIGVLFSKRNQG